MSAFPPTEPPPSKGLFVEPVRHANIFSALGMAMESTFVYLMLNRMPTPAQDKLDEMFITTTNELMADVFRDEPLRQKEIEFLVAPQAKRIQQLLSDYKQRTERDMANGKSFGGLATGFGV